MWWKLGGLVVLTAALVLAVIPIRTHAVLDDPTSNLPHPRASVGDMLSNMYLTPATGIIIMLILAFAAFVALKVVRGHW